ncbi:homeobox protein Hox-B3 [Cocos nucifera]|uniref:Homeobox protein Hox-B3 n=1 Tax=Cocos nucifera TaxID=13894 RepID=A0A8K0HSM0_COCNU|nr:homeobox protein Hox-B3 [Cocos nucifera]
MGGGGGEAASSSAASTCSSSSAAAASQNGKRGRDPEDEVYLDNFHSHKRYLSEIMASSMNGLSVGDSLPENLMESPARSESICYPRDEIASQYSPMSEDSDDSRYCETPLNTTTIQSDVMSSPTSPVSPHRHQKVTVFSSSNPYPLPSCTLASVVCSHPRHQRGSDSEGRFPSSPNDVCHTADLRRAALLRSVQMRAQPHCPPAYELPFNGGQENIQSVEDGEDRSFSCIKTLDDETGYQCPEPEADFIEGCSSVDGLAGSKLSQE